MKREIDIDAILAPIPGDNPAGEDLRYSPAYDEIKEARRSDDTLDQGDWKHKIKVSDWDTVITKSVEALVEKTKDLQIAIWLTEALIKTEGFDGFIAGFKILVGFLRNLWEHVFPEIEEGDLDFRIGPLEFINNKLSLCIKQTPITDEGKTPGYSWMKWKESRQVGYEKNTINQYGDVDENKKKARDEMIADGKLTAEDFDSAVDISSGTYYVSLEEKLTSGRDIFRDFENVVDEKFGSNAPRLAEFKKALEDLEQFLSGEKISEMILKEKQKHEIEKEVSILQEEEKEGGGEEEEDLFSSVTSGVPFPADLFSDLESIERNLWEEAIKDLKTSGMKKVLGRLYSASCCMPSVRGKSRYKLLMAKLCLKASRPDLARPIVEELQAFIEELNLERWESPMWIAEVLNTLYQCLTTGTHSEEDIQRANELLKKICIKDVTKAVIYSS